jgi:hypothetical protein
MILTHALRLVAATVTAGALSACASGPITGLLTVPGQEPEPVTLSYESSLFGKSGKMWGVLPGGQRFAGGYTLQPYAPDHHMVATLTGPAGRTLACRFRLNEPGVGPDKGGTAQCQLSTGGTFDARF